MSKHMFNIIFEWIIFLFGKKFYGGGDIFEIETYVHYICKCVE